MFEKDLKFWTLKVVKSGYFLPFPIMKETELQLEIRDRSP